MSQSVRLRQSPSEIWFLTSELEGERASSFRQERWCRIFLEAGSKLRIFNLRGALDHSDAIIEDLGALQRFREQGLAHRKGPQASVREGWLVKLVRRLKHLLLADLYLPNVLRLQRHLDRLLASHQGPPLIIMASSPPFSVALVAARLKRRYPEKMLLTVDMRDAWALHNALGGIRPLKRWIEGRALRTADSVTTVSRGLADEFRETYGVDAGVMYNVATHYLDAPPAAAVDLQEICRQIDPRRRVLVYTGSTPIGHYDKEAIVGAVRLLRQRRPEMADRVQLVFVGACQEIRDEAERQAIGHDDIVFVAHLPHAVARSVQASADAMLFLAHFGPKNLGVVSTKLFEYLCLGQPVLPLSLHEGSDVDVLLRRYCGTSVNLHSAEQMAQALAEIAERGVDHLPRLREVHRVRELVDDYRDHAHRLLA